MGEFNPRENQADLEYLSAKVERIHKNLIARIESWKGELRVGEKVYPFTGIGTWLDFYIDWYKRSKQALLAKIRGYNKLDRYDKMVSLVMAANDEATKKGMKTYNSLDRDYLKEMETLILAQDKEMADPSEVETEMNALNEKINKNVLKRLFPKEEFDDVQAGIVFEKLIQHLESQQDAVISFLGNVEDISAIIYDEKVKSP